MPKLRVGTMLCKSLPGWRACLLLAVVAALLLVTSDEVLALFPVSFKISSNGSVATISVDGQSKTIHVTQSPRAIQFAPMEPYKREYQIDGSDSTNNFTFDPEYFARFASSPYYRFQALLRDEQSYSSWRNLVIRDQAGSLVTSQPRPPDGLPISLPQAFDISVDLYRIEAPRSIELTDESGGILRVEINRNDKYVRVVQAARNAPDRELAKWFFPVDWRPELAELVYMAMRVIAFGIMIVLGLVLLAGLLPVRASWRPGKRTILGALIVAMGFALFMSYLSSVILFDKAPHILDAVSYYFQAKVFAGGALAAPAPPVKEAFPVPFTVVSDGKWFSQYPPGTSLMLAIGFILGLPWLVEPVLAIAAVLLVYWIGRRQYGRSVGILAAVLMGTSPFLHLQAGSFLSHVPAMFFAALFLFAATHHIEKPQAGWAIVAAVGLGFAFLTREIVAVLYGLPVGLYVAVQAYRKHGVRSLSPLAIGFTCLALFGLAYLLYNNALTGSPWQLPRTMYNPGDKYGFGQGIGFYGQHTPAAGLVNTDELLTSLTIYLFGWPFYLSLAILAIPFVFRRAGPWDMVNGVVAALFVVAYFGYFYHGIAIGPRYYFEALPVFALLTARGFAVMAAVSASTLRSMGREDVWYSSQIAALGVCGVLLMSNLLYFEPRQIALYDGYSGMPGSGGPVLGDFVHHDTAGRAPALSNAIVTTGDWWVYSTYLAAMNCPLLNCQTVLAFAPDGAGAQRLRDAFPNRTWYTLQRQGNLLSAQPDGMVSSPSAPSSSPSPPASGSAKSDDFRLNVPPDQMALAVTFENSSLGTRGERPSDESSFQGTSGRHGDGALLSEGGHLTYSGIPLNPQQGAIGLWVQPRWDGGDFASHVFVEAGGAAARLRLSKDGANNLRFQIWDGATESDLGYNVVSWKKGEWHYVAGIWGPNGQMKLIVDGSVAAERPAHLPQRVTGTINLGTTEDRALGCDCVVDDLEVAQTPADVTGASPLK